MTTRTILNRLLLLLIVCFIYVQPNYAQDQQQSLSPLLLIYDASGSMWGKMETKTKKEVASSVLSSTVDKLQTGQEIGLIAYGHRTKGDCNDVEFLVDLNNTDKEIIKSKVNAINPLGKTPLAKSAKMAINSLKSTNTRATIILITDGIESCNGNLCEVVRLAKEEGVEFKLHIVGFGLKDDELDALKCAAKEGGGNYYDAANADQLNQAMDEAVHEKIDDPIPNHSFFAVKNGEPVDVWIKIKDTKTGDEIRGARTYQDTAKIHIPVGNYELQVNPLEGTDIAAKTLMLDKQNGEMAHTDISFDGGKIDVFITNNNEGWDATVRIYDQITNKSVAQGRTYGRHKTIELNAGTYNIEILPMKLKGLSLQHKIENFKVNSGETVALDHNFESGILKIGAITKSGELVDAVVKIHQESDDAYVTGTRTYTTASSNPKEVKILPGSFKVYINTLGKHKGVNKTQIVTVKSGEETTYIFKID